MYKCRRMASVLASVLDNMEEVEDSMRNKATPSVRDVGFSAIHRVTRFLPKNQVNELITLCLLRRYYNCAVAVAVHTERMSQVFGKLPDFGNQFWNEWVATLIRKRAWKRVQEILTHFSSYAFSEYLDKLASSTLDNEGLHVFNILLKPCPMDDTRILWRVAFNVSIEASSQKLSCLLRSDSPAVQYFIPAFTADTAHRILLLKKDRYKKSFCGEPIEINDCLGMVYESGLFAAFANSSLAPGARMIAATDAVDCLMPDAVQFLYHAGVMNNHILHQLRQKQERQGDNSASDVDPQTARRIRRFLSHKASCPRSLQVLCLREVSRMGGWGCRRQRFIENLKLPKMFIRELELTDGRKLLKP